MQPLIITAADPKIPEGSGVVRQTVEEAVRSFEQGATIIHLHLAFTPQVPGKHLEFDIPRSREIVESVRERCPGAVIQVGKTTATNESRIAFCDEVAVDMLSLTLSDNDKYVSSGIPANHRNRDEFVQMTEYCREHGIRPELEIFHAGATWNLRYLIARGCVTAPYWINICLYHEGGGWSPRTFDEVDYRVALLPEGCRWHLTVFAKPEDDFIVPPTSPEEHTRMLAHAILRGGHVRIGKEDRPELSSGRLAESNAALVKKVVEMAYVLERPVATPEQAREILGLNQSAGPSV